jgi:hypothetical protein
MYIKTNTKNRERERERERERNYKNRKFNKKPLKENFFACIQKL